MRRSLDEFADPRQVGGQDGSIPITLNSFALFSRGGCAPKLAKMLC
jgi:hypothetical protein